MSRIIVLDATPLGLLSNPRQTSASTRCQTWAADLVAAGCRLIVPEMSDYEVRRELVRGGRTRSVRMLDALARQHEYLPLSTFAMRFAADFWATAWRQGLPTAGPNRLDADVILAAQAFALFEPNVVVATGNPAHLSRYVPAEQWDRITP